MTKRTRTVLLLAVSGGLALSALAWFAAQRRPSQGQPIQKQLSDAESIKVLHAKLSQEEKNAIDTFRVPEVRYLYTMGFAAKQNPNVCAAHMQSFLAAMRASPVKMPDAPQGEVFAHPDNAAFAASTVIRAAIDGADVLGAWSEVQSQMVRLSSCDDEATRIFIAAGLLAIRERKLGGGLSSAADATLNKLLSNEMIALYAKKSFDATFAEKPE